MTFKLEELSSIADARERAMATFQTYTELLDKICDGNPVGWDVPKGGDLPWHDYRWLDMVRARLRSVGKTEADARKWDAIKELVAQIKVPK